MVERAFVRILKRARRDLEALSIEHRRKVAAQIQALASDPSPRGSDTMYGQESLTLRVRVGTYRVCYEVREDEIVVVTVTSGIRPGALAFESLAPCSSPDSAGRARNGTP
jgi:mRNA interferase RelE/StbE